MYLKNNQLKFTPKRLRTKEHIFKGSLTIEKLVEPGCNSEEDTHVICDNDSTPLLNMSYGNVENVNIVANSDDHESMINVRNLNQSPQLLRCIRLYCPTTLWMV